MPRIFRSWLPTSVLLILTALAPTLHLSSPSTISGSKILQHPKQALNTYIAHATGDDKHVWPGQDLATWEKPEGLRGVGLIFYGRRDLVRILDCFLRRNLIRNGGMMDEVIFVLRTENQPNIDWLDEAVARTPEYTKSIIAEGRGRNFNDAYSVVEKGVMYIKMDDDIVFIEDTAIPAIVQRKYLNPQYLAVSANSRNQPAITWVHYHLGAMRPYLPELTPPPTYDPQTPTNPTPTSWRSSELPIWTGPENYTISETDPAPYAGCPWPQGQISIPPLLIYFLANLEREELWRYKFDMWDYHYDRLSEDVIENGLVAASDEWWLTVYLPDRLKRHVVLDGRGLTVHFGFRRQVGSMKGHALAWTDALSRYKAYANEMICNAEQ